MAYQADILINVRGFQDLGRIQKALEGTAHKIDQVNLAAARLGAPVRNLERFTNQLILAEKALSKVAIGSPQEQRAISNYVTALNNSNIARERQNKLIQEEITKRNAVSNAIRANVEANIAESRAARAARDEAMRMNKALAEQERLRRNLEKRGLMQLSSGSIAKGVADAGFGVQGPAVPPGGIKKPGAGGVKGGLGFNPAATAENLALGAGFPLLFGGGAGQVAGGLIGSFFGAGFGGQILGSALGQQLEDAITRINDIGKATKTLNLDTLRESVIAVNADLDITVERLIKAGQADAARAAIGKQVALQTGLLPEATAATEQAVSALSTAWNEVVGAVSGLLSLLGRPFVSALAVILQGIAKAAQGMNILIQLMNKYIPGIAIANRLWVEIEKRLPKIAEDQEQLRAEIERQTDAYSKQIGRSMKLEEIDKRRNKGNTADAKIQNNELDRQVKIEDLRGKTEDKIAEARLKFRGQDISLLEDQIRAEAAIQERAINREAARQRERLELEKALDIIKATLTAEQSRISVQRAYREQNLRLVQSELELNKELVNVEVSRLDSQIQYAMSLNQTSALIDKIAVNQVRSAQLEEETARLQADNAVEAAVTEKERAAAAAFSASQEWLKLGRQGDLTEAKKAELQAILDQEPVAARNLEVTRATAEQTKVAAAARLEHNKYTIDLERREKQVAAYAAEMARESERASRAAQEQLSAINNSVNRTQSLHQAAITINNAAADLLRIKLEEAATDEDRKAIINKIKEIEIANAELTLYSTIAQIKADLERQVIALRLAEIKYREYEAVVLMAKAQGTVKKEHYQALEAQASSLRIAHDTLKVTREIASAQEKAATAVFRSNVAIAEANAQRQIQAVDQGVSKFRTGQFGTTTQTITYTDEEQKKLGIGRYARAYASGGYVTGPTRAIVGEGGESEYIIPASKMSAAMARYASGRRGDSVIPGGNTPGAAGGDMGSTSINPMINVTTGPVMNMNGSNYVSQRDFVAGMQAASRRGAEMALSAMRKSGGIRRSVGAR